MKGLLFRGTRDVRFEDTPDPTLQSATDAIVRVTHTAICGSDLHVYCGRESGLDHGTPLGHEFVGDVIETGSAVTDLDVGARVVSPFSTACGTCTFCVGGLSARCERGQLFGWMQQGEGLPGGQAELVRVPLASSTLVELPDGITPASSVLLADVLPTGFYCATRAEVKSGGVYAVVGCGPVGLMTVLASLELGGERVFAIDRVPERLALAETFGAIPIDGSQVDAAAFVNDATDGRGVDAVMEAVGTGRAAQLAYALVRPGGIISVIGVHTDVALSLTPAELYDKNITLRLGRCPARSLMEGLIPLAMERSRDLSSVFTHRMPLSNGAVGYRIFEERSDGCIKVLLEP